MNLFQIVCFIAFAFMCLPKLSAQDCGTVAPNYDILAAYPSSKKTGNNGPFYVKIYPTIVRKSDLTGGAAQQDVIEAVEELKADFEPHNIYFHYSCIGYHNDTEDYYNPEGALGLYPAPDDGIVLLLYDQIPGGTAGTSGIPGRKLWAYLYTHKTLTHEMGHALGLYHTHQSTECSNWPAENEYVDGTECDIRGDYVCDTDASPNFATETGDNYVTCIFTNPSCVDPNNDPYVNADMRNIMSYGSICREYFEPGQGERMRNTLTLDAILEGVQRNWAYVKGTTTIDVPHYADVDIIVSEGATLYYNDLLELAPERKVIVETAGRLHLNSAIFTIGDEESLCPTEEVLWGGIRLASGAPLNYAYATMESSTIEHAKTGITWHKPSSNVINGRFRARNTHFLNNEIAIHLADRFPNQLLALPSNLVACTLDIDGEFMADRFDQHVLLRYCNPGLTITDSKFTRTLTSISGKKRGIDSYASRVAMADNGLYTLQAELEKFDQAINARTGATYTYPLLFRNVEFDLNTLGIDAMSVNSINVQDCEFNVPDVSSGFAGIRLQAGTGFIIFDNDFISVGNNVANKFGIRLSQTSVESNVIAENMFQNMGTANLAHGNNGGNMSGLQYLCNTVDNSKQHDFYINPGTTVALTQGKEDDPAGNKFTQNQSPQTPQGSDFYNAPTNAGITYYFFNGDPVQEPLNSINLDKRDIDISSSCIYRNLLSSDVDSLDILYDMIKSDYDSLITIYDETIDAGEKLIISSYIREADVRLNVVSNSALQVIQNDTTEIDWSKTREWLERKNSFVSDIGIASTYLSEDDENSFTSFVATIPGRRILTSEDSIDYGLFVDLTDLLLEAKADDRADSELDSLEVESLEVIAETNDRMVAGMAKGILETFYGYQFQDTISLRTFEETESLKSLGQSPILIYPHPFFDEVVFGFPIGTYKLQVRSQTGIVVGQMACENCSEMTWNASNLPGGIYIFELVSMHGKSNGLILKVVR